MKLSSSSLYRSSNFPIILKSSACSSPCRSFCLSSLSYPQTSLKPQIPLFLRPPKYSTTLHDLKKWHDWTKNLASSIGSTFEQSDNGPNSTVLCRELKWLLEDAVEDHTLLPQMSVQNDRRVTMRAEVDELYNLWKQRIHERRPFQYIVGCEHWRDLVLSVQEGILIPRPETELIVDLVSNVVSKDDELK